MKWYGCTQYHVEEMRNAHEPVVGMGVTEYLDLDRRPYEVTKVIDDRHIFVRRLYSMRIDHRGISERQEYEYFSCPYSPSIRLFKTKKGCWRERIGRNGLGGTTFAIGYAECYYDYSF